MPNLKIQRTEIIFHRRATALSQRGDFDNVYHVAFDTAEEMLWAGTEGTRAPFSICPAAATDGGDKTSRIPTSAAQSRRISGQLLHAVPHKVRLHSCPCSSYHLPSAPGRCCPKYCPSCPFCFAFHASGVSRYSGAALTLSPNTIRIHTTGCVPSFGFEDSDGGLRSVCAEQPASARYVLGREEAYLQARNSGSLGSSHKQP